MTMNTALNHLNDLINDGIEYPDAHYTTTTLFGCDSDALQAAYDQQFTAENGTTTE